MTLSVYQLRVGLKELLQDTAYRLLEAIAREPGSRRAFASDLCRFLKLLDREGHKLRFVSIGQINTHDHTTFWPLAMRADHCSLNNI